VLHGVLSDWPDARALRFGLAAAGFKHSVPGDFNLASEAMILEALADEDLSVRR
jgi:2-dehydro-3-deoxygluconokinase